MGKRKTQPLAPVEQLEKDQATPVEQAPLTEQIETPPDEEVVQPVEEPAVADTAPEPEPEPEPAGRELSPRAIELLAALLVPAEDKALTEVEPLAAYVARIEEQAQPLPVCQITHPDAKDGAVHVGKYAGIRLVRGDTPAALLSDGTVI